MRKIATLLLIGIAVASLAYAQRPGNLDRRNFARDGRPLRTQLQKGEPIVRKIAGEKEMETEIVIVMVESERSLLTQKTQLEDQISELEYQIEQHTTAIGEIDEKLKIVQGPDTP